MVYCTLFLTRDEVMNGLESFLRERKYRNVISNRDSYTITAWRRDSLLSRKYMVQLEVKKKSDTVSDIEIQVNPQSATHDQHDLDRENKIRSRIYFHF